MSALWRAALYNTDWAQHSTADDTATCPLYGEQSCITEHSTADDTATCRPLYGEQRCTIQTEHSTAGDKATRRPLYGQQRCIIHTPPLQAVHCSALNVQRTSSTSTQQLLPTSHSDIAISLNLKRSKTVSQDWHSEVSRMCCFARQKSTLQYRLLLFPPLSGSLGTYMTTNRHTLITLSDNSGRSTLFQSTLCRSLRVSLWCPAVNTGLLLATFKNQVPAMLLFGSQTRAISSKHVV